MTHYFDGMDDLLREAFTRVRTSISDRFKRRMAAAADADAARQAVAAIILEDVFGDDRELVLSHELYILAAREPAYRSITTDWMGRSRARRAAADRALQHTRAQAALSRNDDDTRHPRDSPGTSRRPQQRPTTSATIEGA